MGIPLLKALQLEEVATEFRRGFGAADVRVRVEEGRPVVRPDQPKGVVDMREEIGRDVDRGVVLLLGGPTGVIPDNPLRTRRRTPHALLLAHSGVPAGRYRFIQSKRSPYSSNS